MISLVSPWIAITSPPLVVEKITSPSSQAQIQKHLVVIPKKTIFSRGAPHLYILSFKGRVLTMPNEPAILSQ